MNRLARLQPGIRSTTRSIAKLGLQADGQPELHDFIRRMHTGRWPMLGCLNMRKINGVIYEAAELRRMASPRFRVIRWRPDGLGLSWAVVGSAREALSTLQTTEGWSQVTDPQKTH